MATREPFAQIVAQGNRPDPQLRLHSSDPEGATPEPSDPREYQALRTGRRPPRLRIRGHYGPGHSLPYTGLLDMLADDRHAACFSLVFHHQVVHVTGRNLTEVIDAIHDQRAVQLRVYDPQAYDAPAEGAPVIEGVEYEGGTVMEELVSMIAN